MNVWVKVGEDTAASTPLSTGVSPPKATTITCTAAYRSSVDVGIEREETLFWGGDVVLV